MHGKEDARVLSPTFGEHIFFLGNGSRRCSPGRRIAGLQRKTRKDQSFTEAQMDGDQGE
jgi:hypothetical protein